MNLTELIAETRARISETTEADFFTDAQITRSLNEGLRRFTNAERWPWLYTEFSDTLGLGESELTLPDDVALNRVFALSIMDSVNLAGGVMLERIQPVEGFRMRMAYNDRQGTPQYYYIAGTNLDADGSPPTRYTAKFIPEADAEYEIGGIYMFVPPLLDAGDDEPALPTEYQDALPAYAAGLLYLQELEISQKASEQFTLYTNILGEAVKDTKQFDADEVVAWGRSKPAGRGFGRDIDPFWSRITSAGLGQ